MTVRAKKHWSPEEDKVLIDTITAAYRPFDLLAKQLDRPAMGVKQRTEKLVRSGQIPKHEMWWTDKEVAKLRRRILLAETNEVINIPELAKALNKKESAIKDKIHWLRERGELARADRSLQFDDYRRPYTEREEQMLIHMYKQELSLNYMAEKLNRTIPGIQGKLSNLRRQGKLANRIKIWTNEEVKFLIRSLRFDSYGYTTNVKDISEILNLSYEQVSWKVKGLRKEGVIRILPDKTKTSVNSTEAFYEYMKQFNEKRHISYKIKKQMNSIPEQKKTNSDGHPSRQVTN